MASDKVGRASGARLLGKGLQRLAIGVVLAGMIVWATGALDRLPDLGSVAAAMTDISPGQYILAFVLVFVSYAAAGEYERVIHRILRTGIAPDRARRAGWCATALGQAAGMGPVTGAIARWTLMPGTGFGLAARVSAAVAASFLVAWLMVTAIAVAIGPAASVEGLGGHAALVLAVSGVLGLSCAKRGRAPRYGAACSPRVDRTAAGPKSTLPTAGRTFAKFLHVRLATLRSVLPLPSARDCLLLLAIAAVDVLALAGAFCTLLSGSTNAVGWAEGMAPFLMALGAGLVTATPAGLGGFDAALLTLLPAIDAATLVAAIVAYRCVGVLVPAVLAIGVVVRAGLAAEERRRRVAGCRAIGEAEAAGLASGLTGAAEVQLIRQGHLGAIVSTVPGPIRARWPRAEARIGAWVDVAPATHESQSRAPTPDPLPVGSEPIGLWPIGRPGNSLTALGSVGFHAPRIGSEDRNAGANGALTGGRTMESAMIEALCQVARDEGRSPVMYKSDARMTATARRRGFRAIKIAAEAVLCPQTFAPESPSRAGLRRKLRKARRAGIQVTGYQPGWRGDTAKPETAWTVTHSGPPKGRAYQASSSGRFSAQSDRPGLPAISPPDLADLAEVSALWAAAHDGERGFSTGRYADDYVSGQAIWIALDRGGAIAGFATFHVGSREWTLDLMRQRPGVPDGTMHSLIAAAIADAAEAGVTRLSLAAAPPDGARMHGTGQGGWLARRYAHLARRAGGAGLAQFKQMFDPKWEPRYIAAPTALALVRAGLAIAWAIRYPGPLPSSGQIALRNPALGGEFGTLPSDDAVSASTRAA